MKEQEPQPPGFIEGLGIKSALWFEGKLDEWSSPQEPVSRWKWSRRKTLYTTGIVAAGVGVWSYYSLHQKGLPKLEPKPFDAKLDMLESRLDYGRFTASKNWVLANFATGLAVRVLPELLDQILEDPLVNIKLPEKTTCVTFLVSDTLHKQPTRDNLFGFAEQQHSSVLSQSKQILEPSGFGVSFRKIISIVDRQKVVISRNPAYYNLTSPINGMMMSRDLSFTWVASLKDIALGNNFPEVSQLDLSPEIRGLITSKKIDGVLRLPIEIEYLEPDYIERAKRL